jgi:hypothetical protein
MDECQILDKGLEYAFEWDLSPQGHEFWDDLNDGTIKNNGWLQLPENHEDE